MGKSSMARVPADDVSTALGQGQCRSTRAKGRSRPQASARARRTSSERSGWRRGLSCVGVECRGTATLQAEKRHHRGAGLLSLQLRLVLLTVSVSLQLDRGNYTITSTESRVANAISGTLAVVLVATSPRPQIARQHCVTSSHERLTSSFSGCVV